MSRTKADSARYLSPPVVAKRLGVTPESVLAWIRRGELRAFNLGSRTARRPRYKIDPADLEIFLSGRQVMAPVKATRGRRRDPEVYQYF